MLWKVQVHHIVHVYVTYSTYIRVESINRSNFQLHCIDVMLIQSYVLYIIIAANALRISSYYVQSYILNIFL